MQLTLSNQAATENLGQQLATWVQDLPDNQPVVIYVAGELGAGKTTLVRALLRAAGVTGPIKSPTYALVEPYLLGQRRCYHIDLYRLADPQELEFLGLEDWLAEAAVLLVEWPDKGQGVLPAADLEVRLDYAKANARRVSLKARLGTSPPKLIDLK